MGSNRAREGWSEPRAGFDACFDEHASRILAFALRRVRGRDAAEDVVAETFSVVWRRRESVPEAPLSWLCSIALNVISNPRRLRRRGFKLQDRLEAEPVPYGRDPAELVADRDQIQLAFHGLSESQREVLRLAFWEDLSPVDASTVLGCSAGAYRVRLHRARRELAKQLASTGHQTAQGAESTDARRPPASQQAR